MNPRIAYLSKIQDKQIPQKVQRVVDGIVSDLEGDLLNKGADSLIYAAVVDATYSSNSPYHMTSAKEIGARLREIGSERRGEDNRALFQIGDDENYHEVRMTSELSGLLEQVGHSIEAISKRQDPI